MGGRPPPAAPGAADGPLLGAPPAGRGGGTKAADAAPGAGFGAGLAGGAGAAGVVVEGVVVLLVMSKSKVVYFLEPPVKIFRKFDCFSCDVCGFC